MSGRDWVEGSLGDALCPDGVVVGELVAIAGDGEVPLVAIPGRPSAAVPARTTVDLHSAHIGRPVVLMFEGGHAARPIIIGLLRGSGGDWPAAKRPTQVQIDADGERLVVSAAGQLALRCGRASITLTHSGKVLIQGTYVSSRSSGANRIKGGSVQIN